MLWVEFADEAAFGSYHDQSCKEHGIPKPGTNAASGEVALDTQWTTAWVEPQTVDGVIVALVPDEDAKVLVPVRKSIAQKIDAAAVTAIGVPSPFVKATFETAKPVPTDKLDIAVILVDREIRTKEEAVALLKVDPVALDTALAEVDVIVEPVEPVIKKP